MTPSILLSQPIFEELQQLAEPLVDTPESVIRRLLESYKGLGSPPKPSSPSAPPPLNKSRSFDPVTPPNLTHTKVTSAILGGRTLASANWNRLLDEALREAKKKLGSFDAVRRIAMVNIFNGRKEDEGYHYLDGAGISVQGQDANSAWRGTIQIARNLHCTVEVDFIWRNKEGAERPGEAGRFVFQGDAKP